MAGNDKDSTLICFASKSMNAGQVTSKMHVIELGAQPGIRQLDHCIDYLSITNLLGHSYGLI